MPRPPSKTEVSPQGVVSHWVANLHLEAPKARLVNGLRLIIAYGLIPNVAFWVLGGRFFLVRPAFNVDYLIVGALPRLKAKGRAVVFGLVLALDIVINAARNLHFTVPELLRNLRFLANISPSAYLTIVMALAAMAITIAVETVFLGGDRSRHTVLAMITLCAMEALDLASGTSFLSVGTNRDMAERAAGELMAGTSYLPAGIARTFLTALLANSGVGMVLVTVLQPLDKPIPLKEEDSAAGHLLAAARDPAQTLPNRNQALIIVESMGLFRDAPTAERLLEPLTRLQGRYQVRVGSVPFHGATRSGELRELCGVRGFVPEQLPPNCLPAAMAARGYRTSALHGNFHDFYNRSVWYPKIGFEEISFKEDLKAKGLSGTCDDIFSALCDVDVAKVMSRELAPHPDGKPAFAYWLTVSSHLPVVKVVKDTGGWDCAESPVTQKEPDVCKQAQALSVALKSIARIASDPKLPPTDFIVVGDHAPPFEKQAEREAFDLTHVPFVTLTWSGESRSR